MAAKRFELARQQCEMHRFVGGNREEVAHKIPPCLSAKAPRHIERKVDRDEFDMRQRMP